MKHRYTPLLILGLLSITAVGACSDQGPKKEGAAPAPPEQIAFAKEYVKRLKEGDIAYCSYNLNPAFVSSGTGEKLYLWRFDYLKKPESTGKGESARTPEGAKEGATSPAPDGGKQPKPEKPASPDEGTPGESPVTGHDVTG